MHLAGSRGLIVPIQAHCREHQEDNVLEVDEIRALKTYGWVLGEPEQNQVQKWLQMASSNEIERSSVLVGKKKKDEEVANKGALVVAGSLVRG